MHINHSFILLYVAVTIVNAFAAFGLDETNKYDEQYRNDGTDADRELKMDRILDGSSNGATKPNILMILTDDMNAEFGPYLRADHPLKGNTPNFDKFARNAVTFARAYANFPVCGPSRQSLMSGRYADSTKIYNFEKWLPQVSTKLTTIPQYFKNVLGYYTAAFGKVYHDSDRQPLGNLWNYLDQFSQPVVAHDPYGNLECGDKWFCSFLNKADLTDYQINDAAIKFLRRVKSKSIYPFMMMVGYRRPHISNAIPNGYSNFQNSSDDFPNLKEPSIPDTASFRTSLSRFVCDEISDRSIRLDSLGNWIPVVSTQGGRPTVNSLTDDPKYTYSVKTIRQFYFGAIKWIDELFGALMDELDKQDLSSNTIVIITSDHGFANGDRGVWCKSSLDEIVTRIPLMVRIPPSLDPDNQDSLRKKSKAKKKKANNKNARITIESLQNKGSVSYSMVQLVDIFPTLIDLATSQKAIEFGKVVDDSGLTLDGASFSRSIFQPATITGSASYSQYPRCMSRGLAQTNSCSSDTLLTPCQRPAIKYMGYTIKTRKYRYTEWRNFNEVSGGCRLVLWPGMPSVLRDLGVRKEYLDPSSSTDWSSNAFEQELYYEDDPINSDSLVFSPVSQLLNRAINPFKKDQSIMKALSLMIQYKFDPSKKKVVCNNHGIITLSIVDGKEIEICECDFPWTGGDCSSLLTDAPTAIPTRSPKKVIHRPTSNPTPKTMKPTKLPTPTEFGFRCPLPGQEKICGVKFTTRKKCKGMQGRKNCVWCNGKCNPGRDRAICDERDAFLNFCATIISGSTTPTSTPTILTSTPTSSIASARHALSK